MAFFWNNKPPQYDPIQDWDVSDEKAQREMARKAVAQAEEDEARRNRKLIDSLSEAERTDPSARWVKYGLDTVFHARPLVDFDAKYGSWIEAGPWEVGALIGTVAAQTAKDAGKAAAHNIKEDLGVVAHNINKTIGLEKSDPAIAVADNNEPNLKDKLPRKTWNPGRNPGSTNSIA